MWDVPEREWGVERFEGGSDAETVERFLRELRRYERAFVRSVRQFVTSHPFSSLLRTVYAAYPAYAVNSRLTLQRPPS